MDKTLRDIGLTENEIKVYKALLKLKKGTKTPIVKQAKVLSSKVYEILDRLIEKGFVTFFIENNIKQYVPVPPENVNELFDEKIKNLEEQKKEFQVEMEKFSSSDFITEAQVFRNWDGLRQAFNIVINDLGLNGTYYILGMNPGVAYQKASSFFPAIDKKFEEKRIKYKAIHRLKTKELAKDYLKAHGKERWSIRYYDLNEPFEIGIAKDYTLLILLEKEPITFMIHNKKIRNSFMQYFEIIWKQSVK